MKSSSNTETVAVVPAVPVDSVIFVKPPERDVEFLRIAKDGTITLGPDLTWDDAAAHLVATLERTFGVMGTSVSLDLSRLRQRVLDLESALVDVVAQAPNAIEKARTLLSESEVQDGKA